MNLGQLLRTSWSLTWRQWRLWLLSLLMFLAIVPTMLLSAGVAGLSVVLSLPGADEQAAWLSALRQQPAGQWLALLGVALALVVVTAVISWTLQAAAMRGAALAAENGAFTLREALQLGRQRFVNILLLSAVLSLTLAVLSLAPPLLTLFLVDWLGYDAVLLHTLQTGLAPVNVIISLVLLFVLMAIALEDLSPKRAFRRAWSVFRQAWWAYTLVLSLSFAPILILVLLVLPAAVLVVLAQVLELGWLMLAACTAVLIPTTVVLMLFTGVYTSVLYTLIYRQAATQLPAAAA